MAVGRSLEFASYVAVDCHRRGGGVAGALITLDRFQSETVRHPFCRLDGLMAGALLASVVRIDGFRATAFVTPARMTLIVTALLAWVAETADARWIAFSFVAIASMAFVYLRCLTVTRG